MNFKDYKILVDINSTKIELFLTTEEEIRQCEKDLNIFFEYDYIEYVLTLGNGILGGTYIRVYLPERITKTLLEWRERITEYWFWDEGKEVLTKEEVLNSVRIGDTLGGDEIILFKHEYYVLPRQDDKIYKIGATLDKAISWLCSSGVLTEPFFERYFEPFDPKEWS
jgi:hypothetical protein